MDSGSGVCRPAVSCSGAGGQSRSLFHPRLSQRKEIDRLVSEVASRFGRIDLLINGAALRSWEPLLATGALDLSESLFHVNVLAPLQLSVGLAQRLWRSDPNTNVRSFNRNIVNISSTGGLLVYPDLGQALYGMSKAALNHLICAFR